MIKNTMIFGLEAEANLVNGLRQHAKPCISLAYDVRLKNPRAYYVFSGLSSRRLYS